MGETLSRIFPADTHAPRSARDALREVSEEFDDELAFRAELLVSECVSTRVLEQSQIGMGGSVRVDVWDRTMGVMFEIHDQDTVGTAPAGSGRMRWEFAMLETLADEWGMIGDAMNGVWFWLERGRFTDDRVLEGYAAAFARAMQERDQIS